MSKFLRKRIASFGYAFNGIGYVFKTQPNIWIHLCATVIVLSAALFLRLALVEIIVLVLVIAIVWITEFINTAIELSVDLISPQYHPSAKVIKDIAAGAVLISALTSIIIGLVIFVPPLLKLLGLS